MLTGSLTTSYPASLSRMPCSALSRTPKIPNQLIIIEHQWTEAAVHTHNPL
jgi:hypothetical protein